VDDLAGWRRETSPGGDRQHQGQYGSCPGLAEQAGGDRHGPAGLQPVVDQQDGTAEPGNRVGGLLRDYQRLPERGQPVSAVVLAADVGLAGVALLAIAGLVAGLAGVALLAIAGLVAGLAGVALLAIAGLVAGLAGVALLAAAGLVAGLAGVALLAAAGAGGPSRDRSGLRAPVLARRTVPRGSCRTPRCPAPSPRLATSSAARSPCPGATGGRGPPRSPLSLPGAGGAGCPVGAGRPGEAAS